MTVEVINLQGGSGAAGGNSAYFADSMLTPDQPFYIGNYWSGVSLQGNATGVSQSLLDAMTNRAAAGITLANPGPVYSPQQTWFPMRVNHAALWGVKQFAEFVPVSMTVPAANGQSFMGPCVFFESNGGSGYLLEVDNLTTGLTRWSLVKTFSAFAATTTLIAFTASDYLRTMRLEVVPNTPVAGQNTLTVYENGVIVGTVVDSVAPIPVSGVPAMQLFIRGGPPQTGVFKNFKCGTLPQISNALNFP